MPVPSDTPILQRLEYLNTSSSDFGDQLYEVLRGREYIECVPGLGRDDIVWLIDYLDNALNVLEPSGDPFRKCLRRLRKACGTEGILPTSYLLESERLRIDPQPFATGGYSDVYKGTLDGSVVCIKRMRPPPMHDSEKAKKAFCQEAVIWKRLEHPNIAPLLGITTSPHLQLISCWMPGGDLPGYVTECPDANLIRLLSDVARGLQYLHNCGVVHGDLKGPNILVDDSGHAQISDFGLTLVTNNLHSVASASGPRGHTLRWTAPEVLQEGKCTREMDIFSFAMVMYEVFTGEIPFIGKPAATVLFDIVSGERPTRPIHTLFTENLWSLMQRCWAHDPKLRPSASEVLQILDRMAAVRPLEAPPSNPLLQELYNLDRFPPGFDDRLSTVLHRDEYKKCTTDLKDGSLKWLVNYLDRALDDLPPFSPAFSNCLRELGSICGAKKILPASCMPLSPLMISPETMVISRGRGEVSQGTLGNSTVCVKRVWAEGAPNHFYRGAATWKRLEHPNLVPILGVTTQPFQVISSWIPGSDLLGGVKNPKADLLGLLSDIAEGLCYLHSCDVIHGDLKGFNIIIDDSSHTRITDFGLAVVTSRYTQRWAAPEVLGCGKHSKEADIFSFAMVMIETFTGEVPFNEKKTLEVTAAIMAGERPPRPMHPALTNELWGLMRNCWNQRPESRMKISQVLGVLRRANSPTWKSLTSDAVEIHERIPLVATLLSDPNQIKMLENLDGKDAQTFVDRIDEVLDRLTPQVYGTALRYLCEICGREALFPKSLKRRPLDGPMDNTTSREHVEVQWKKRKAMGRVFRIWPEDDAKRVRGGFYRQIVVWNALHHQNILPLLGVAMTDDRLIAISERMEAGNIVVFTKADPSVDRLQLLRGAIMGLIYMHDREIIHGNLKGANILIDGQGRARLAGFDLVTVASDQPTTISPSSEDGAIRWMGPELLHPQMFGSNDGSPSEGSDCYALGMVIYQVLSGQVPFARYNDARVSRVVLDGERPPRPQGDQGKLFTDEIWDALCLCWKQRPSDRLSAGGVLNSLGEPRPSLSYSEMDGDTMADTDDLHTICAQDGDEREKIPRVQPQTGKVKEVGRRVISYFSSSR